VLSSRYSDLVIASSQSNDNHGSTLTFATFNPGNAADYRKFVVNQGNWGSRMGFLDFGYSSSGGRTNPHSNINSTDDVMTLDGVSKRVGVNNMTPSYNLDVAGKARVRRGGYDMGSSNNGQIEVSNAGSGDAFISFHREGAWGAHFGLEADNWFTSRGCSAGAGGYTSLRAGSVAVNGNLTVTGTYPGDNLGNHTATTTLNMNGNDIDFVRGDLGEIRSVGRISFDWTTGSYDDANYHGIESQNESGAWDDDIRINSFDGIWNTLDANSNNATSYFKVQEHSTGDGTDLFWVRSADGYAYHKGRLGINTTSPSGLLHVNNADDSDMYYTSTGNLYLQNPESWGGTVRLGAAWNKPGIYVNPDLYLNSESRIIINDNNQENWYFDGDYLYSNGWGRIYATSSNLHLDAGPSSGLYLNWYAGNDVYIGRGNSTARALFNTNGLYLYDGWFRPHGDNGLYFQDGGTGLTRIQADGGTYGSVSTYGSVNSWEGYSIDGRFVFMAQDGGAEWGIYNDVDNWWATLQNIYATHDGYRWWDSYYGVQCMRIQHTNGWNYASYDGDSNWDFYSDRRLKENIENEDNILDRLLKLDVVNYDFIIPPDTEEKIRKAEAEKGVVDHGEKLKEIGFIAQDVEQYFPSLVSETEDERYDFKVKALGYSSFGILAVGGIKELKIEKDKDIAGLNNTITELRSEVEKLRDLVNQLLEEKK